MLSVSAPKGRAKGRGKNTLSNNTCFLLPLLRCSKRYMPRHAPLRAPCRENRTLRLIGQTIIASPLICAQQLFRADADADARARARA